MRALRCLTRRSFGRTALEAALAIDYQSQVGSGRWRQATCLLAAGDRAGAHAAYPTLGMVGSTRKY